MSSMHLPISGKISLTSMPDCPHLWNLNGDLKSAPGFAVGLEPGRLLAVPLRQFGLGVERIDLRRPAVHEQVDDVLRLRREVRRLRRERVGRCGRLIRETREPEHAEAGAVRRGVRAGDGHAAHAVPWYSRSGSAVFVCHRAPERHRSRRLPGREAPADSNSRTFLSPDELPHSFCLICGRTCNDRLRCEVIGAHCRSHRCSRLHSLVQAAAVVAMPASRRRPSPAEVKRSPNARSDLWPACQSTYIISLLASSTWAYCCQRVSLSSVFGGSCRNRSASSCSRSVRCAAEGEAVRRGDALGVARRRASPRAPRRPAPGPP